MKLPSMKRIDKGVYFFHFRKSLKFVFLGGFDPMTVPLFICINLLGLLISIRHPYPLAKVSHKCMDHVKEKVPQQSVYPSKHANTCKLIRD